MTMTATANETNQEAARSERPGDGKLNPVGHIVRIVVVGLASSSKGVKPWSRSKP